MASSFNSTDRSSSADEPSFIVFKEPAPPRYNIIAKALSFSSLAPQEEHFNVYLRIKPSECAETHRVIDSTTLMTHPPQASKTKSSAKKKFTFTRILDVEASQTDVFTCCVLPSVRKLFDGKNAVLMTYGTTSAGKTYTMHGSPEHPGVIPRVAWQIFHSIQELESNDLLQPHQNKLLQLSKEERLRNVEHKKKILGLDLERYQRAYDTSHIAYRTFTGSHFESHQYREVERTLNTLKETEIESNDEAYSVWISMYEIYQENIVDLLEFPNPKGEIPYLTVAGDKGGFYVKNARQVCVDSDHEAYQVLQFGRTNLHRAATALNDKSSRSHCILNITLVGRDKTNDEFTIQRITLADLAGTERAKKTLNDGKRLAESNSINKSLSELGNCLKALRENHHGRQRQMVSVRNSKLTKILNNALMGEEQLTFIVNIAPGPLLYDETMAVLKFSALAQEVIHEAPPLRRRPKSRFSQLFQSNMLGTVRVGIAASMPNLSPATKTTSLGSYSSTTSLSDYDKQTELEEKVREYQQALETKENECREREEKAREYQQALETKENECRELEEKLRQNQEAHSTTDSKTQTTTLHDKNERSETENVHRLYQHELEYSNELEETVENLRKDLGQTICELQEQKRMVRLAQEEIQSLKNKTAVDRINQINQNATELGEALKEERQKSWNEKEKLLKRIGGLQAKHNSLKEEHNVLLAKLEKTQSEFREACKEIGELEEENETLISEMNEMDNALVQQVEKLKAENTELSDQLNSNNMESKLQLAKKSQEIDTLKFQLEKSLSEIAEMKKDFDAEVEKLTGDSRKLRDQLTAVSTEKDQEIGILKFQLEKSLSEIAEMKKDFDVEVEKLTGDNRKLRDQLTAISTEKGQEIDTLKFQLEKSLSEKAEMKKDFDVEVEKLTADNRKLRDQLEKSSSEMAETNTLASQVMKLTTENQAMAESENELAAQVEKLAAENIALQDQMNSISTENGQEIDKLKSQLEECFLKQKIDDETVKKYRAMIQDRERENNELTDVVKALEEEATLSSAKYAQTDVEAKQLQKEMDRLKQRLEECAEENIKGLPELQNQLERLKNEFSNKEKELEAFKRGRDYLVAQHDKEIERFRAEIERLQEESAFTKNVIIGNLKKPVNHEARKSKPLLIDFLSPFTDRVPEPRVQKANPADKSFDSDAPLIELMEAPEARVQASNRRDNSFDSDAPLIDLIQVASKLPLEDLLKISVCGQNDIQKSPLKLASPVIDVKSQETSSQREDATSDDSDLFRENTPVKNQLIAPSTDACDTKVQLTSDEDKPIPVTSPSVGSVRKPRTARKRDLADHPALSKSCRGRRRSKTPENPKSAVKKKLFNCDDFVDIVSPDVQPEPRARSLRPRRK